MRETLGKLTQEEVAGILERPFKTGLKIQHLRARARFLDRKRSRHGAAKKKREN